MGRSPPSRGVGEGARSPPWEGPEGAAWETGLGWQKQLLGTQVGGRARDEERELRV